MAFSADKVTTFEDFQKKTKTFLELSPSQRNSKKLC